MFALAIDPAPSNWEAAFRLADLIEKVEADRANVAPLRLRLDLLARTVGVRLDGELLPHLKGLAGWIGSDGKAVDRASLMLHLDDEAIATRIFERVKPLPNPGPSRPGSGRFLGQVEGKELRLSRVGSAVIATWGDGVIEASLQAHDHADRSGRIFFSGPGLESGPGFLGAAWPSRVPGLLPPETPLSKSISAAPPALWSGTWKGPDQFHLEAKWEGLDAIVRRFLDLIPLDPPPDH